MNLNPITTAEALCIIADEMGIDLESNRETALLTLNRIRNLWYSDPAFQRRKLFDDLLECVPLCDLCEQCIDCGCREYRGFTLPEYMAGPVTAWASTEPVTLRSRWFDKFAGRHAGAVSAFLLTPINGQFATEFDIKEGTKIGLASTTKEDNGKKVIVKGIDCSGAKVISMCATLSGNGTVESDVEFSHVSSVVLPKLAGDVIIRSMVDGRDLSTYTPTSPMVPQYRRFRIDSPCNNICTALVQANRRYRDVFHDTDVVEIGDRLVLEAGASHFRYGKNTTDSKELQRASIDRAEMFNLIRGLVEREEGGHIQDGPIAVRGKRTTKARLPGYRY